MSTTVEMQEFVVRVPAPNLSGDLSELKELLSEVRELKELLAAAGGKLWWTERELAAELGVSPQSLARIRGEGKSNLKYKRVAGKIYYSRKHIEDYLNSGNAQK